MSGGYEFVGGIGSSQDFPWINAAAHREQICRFLKSATQRDHPTLCVLGAGACTDLAIESLLETFASITLVDLDGELLEQALKGRQLDSFEQIEVIGGLDVSGAHSLLKQYGERPSGELLAEIKNVASTAKLPQLQQYDVIVSTCLLSQLQHHVFENVEKDEETLAELLAISRRRHLQLLIEHAKPGGGAILVTDFTSSEALPELAGSGFDVSESSWQKILKGNHFHGMNPLGIIHDLDHDEHLQKMLEKQFTSRPWVWNATERLYACMAFYMVKKS